MNDTINQFRDAIAAVGLISPDTIEPGRIYRFPGAGKSRGNTAGRCFMFPDMRGGWYEDYSSGGEQINWQASGSKPYTNEERQANIERSKAANEAYKVEKERGHALAAVEAEKRFNAATTCTSHPYLTTKGVPCFGLKVEADNTLLVPMRDTAGKLWNVERINPHDFKDKRGLPGGRRTGCFHSIGKIKDNRLIVGEGYATCASIHAATGDAVAVAFNAGNLEPVALALRAKYPALKIIIAADDDHQTPGNPGLTKARAAARAVGGWLAVPVFKEMAA